MAKKPSMGRQKIKIAKIEIKNHLQVTFSKRRSGLFKKASELCILCGVEIAIIVFSPAGKVFSFGHPNVEPIIDRFLSHHHLNKYPSPHHPIIPMMPSNVAVGAHHRVREMMSLHLSEMMGEIEMEKKKGEALDRMRKESRMMNQYWWEAPISELGLEELELLRNSMEELKKNVDNMAAAASVNTNTCTASFLAMNNGVSSYSSSAAVAGSLFDLDEDIKPPRIVVDNTTHHHPELPLIHNFGFY